MTNKNKLTKEQKAILNVISFCKKQIRESFQRAAEQQIESTNGESDFESAWCKSEAYMECEQAKNFARLLERLQSDIR